jgi:uncharacterized protein (DUF1810 family)
MSNLLVSDEFDLQRFLVAQEPVYEKVLAELKAGQKYSHWIWFIFPQIEGLGFSTISRHYSIKNLAEAAAYLQHPILGSRLVECCATVHALQGLSANQVFGSPDDLKFKSCLTLFMQVPEANPVFAHNLEKYFNNQLDEKTLARLANL